MQHEVVLVLYDLKLEDQGHNSITKLNTVALSLGFGAFFTTVQVLGKEIQYGFGGIQFVVPSSGGTVQKKYVVGTSSKSPKEIVSILVELASNFHQANYDIIHHNSNHFSEALVMRLTGQMIPDCVNTLPQFISYFHHLVAHAPKLGELSERMNKSWDGGVNLPPSICSNTHAVIGYLESNSNQPHPGPLLVPKDKNYKAKEGKANEKALAKAAAKSVKAKGKNLPSGYVEHKETWVPVQKIDPMEKGFRPGPVDDIFASELPFRMHSFKPENADFLVDSGDYSDDIFEHSFCRDMSTPPYDDYDSSLGCPLSKPCGLERPPPALLQMDCASSSSTSITPILLGKLEISVEKEPSESSPSSQMLSPSKLYAESLQGMTGESDVQSHDASADWATSVGFSCELGDSINLTGRKEFGNRRSHIGKTAIARIRTESWDLDCNYSARTRRRNSYISARDDYVLASILSSSTLSKGKQTEINDFALRRGPEESKSSCFRKRSMSESSISMRETNDRGVMYVIVLRKRVRERIDELRGYHLSPTQANFLDRLESLIDHHARAYPNLGAKFPSPSSSLIRSISTPLCVPSSSSTKEDRTLTLHELYHAMGLTLKSMKERGHKKGAHPDFLSHSSNGNMASSSESGSENSPRQGGKEQSTFVSGSNGSMASSSESLSENSPRQEPLVQPSALPSNSSSPPNGNIPSSSESLSGKYANQADSKKTSGGLSKSQKKHSFPYSLAFKSTTSPTKSKSAVHVNNKKKSHPSYFMNSKQHKAGMYLEK
eukprot:TRINITY_DN3737_c0_g2_i2.p1 TRINITY_DN3737_c0_g2~~TRINITY_DN3737_c0_g2_i2.p1  ORF type:complete len:775 (-),score=127.17 TRINITY_DN3737_c0_g2_i2:60-2384(-)